MKIIDTRTILNYVSYFGDFYFVGILNTEYHVNKIVKIVLTEMIQLKV